MVLVVAGAFVEEDIVEPRGIPGGLRSGRYRAYFAFSSYTIERLDFDDVLRSVGAETD